MYKRQACIRAAHGGRVVVADVQADKGEAVAQSIVGAFVRCDVSSEADGQAVVAKATSLGRLMGLGNLSLIHISEPTRPYSISYAGFCLTKKTH